MVVECQKCGTRFQLDSARIPEAGIRVRCSRCKHAFHLQNPNVSQESAVHAVAREAAEAGGDVRPGATQDLPLQRGQDSSQSGVVSHDESLSAPADPEPEPEPQDASFTESEPPPPPTAQPSVNANDISGLDDLDDLQNFEDEDDWEFNQELPTEDTSFSLDGGGDDDLGPSESGLDPAQASGLDLEAEPEADEDDLDVDVDSSVLESAHQADAVDFSQESPDFSREPAEISQQQPEYSQQQPELSEQQPNDLPQPGSDFLQQGDDLSQPDIDFSGDVDPNEPAPGFGGKREEGAFGSVDDFSTLMEPDPQEQAAAAEAGVPAEQEDTSEWDFFSDGELESADANPFSIDRSQDYEGGVAEQRAAVSGVDAAPEERSMPRIDTAAAVGSAGRILTATGWVATVVMIIGGVVGGVALSLNSNRHAPGYVELGSMHAGEIEGRWVDTARVGTLYAVTGRLTNPGVSAAAPDAGIEVALLDAKRAPLAGRVATGGLGITVDALREMRADDLEASEQSAAISLASTSIAAGKSIPFIAVFREVPIEAVNFELRTTELPRVTPVAPSFGIDGGEVELPTDAPNGATEPEVAVDGGATSASSPLPEDTPLRAR